jgi:hypothetical protein
VSYQSVDFNKSVAVVGKESFLILLLQIMNHAVQVFRLDSMHPAPRPPFFFFRCSSSDALHAADERQQKEDTMQPAARATAFLAATDNS